MQVVVIPIMDGLNGRLTEEHNEQDHRNPRETEQHASPFHRQI